MLYSNKLVYYTGGSDRRLNNDNDLDDRSDANLTSHATNLRAHLAKSGFTKFRYYTFAI